MTKDDVEAVKWYRKAAEQSIVAAQNNLAGLYHQGQGVAKDLTEAYAWWSLAAMTFEKAAINRDAVAKEMTAEQIYAGSKRMRELRAQIEARLENVGKAQPTRP